LIDSYLRLAARQRGATEEPFISSNIEESLLRHSKQFHRVQKKIPIIVLADGSKMDQRGEFKFAQQSKCSTSSEPETAS
jgi:hypothetical protein